MPGQSQSHVVFSEKISHRVASDGADKSRSKHVVHKAHLLSGEVGYMRARVRVCEYRVIIVAVLKCFLVYRIKQINTQLLHETHPNGSTNSLFVRTRHAPGRPVAIRDSGTDISCAVLREQRLQPTIQQKLASASMYVQSRST